MEKPDFHPHSKMVLQIFVAQVIRKLQGGHQRAENGRKKV